MGDIAWNFAGKFLVDKEGNGSVNKLLITSQTQLNDFFSVLPVKSEAKLEEDILALASK